MNILAFSDLHANKVALEKLKRKSKQADIIISAGDMSLFGRHLKEIMHSLAALHKPVLVLHGNHETVEEINELATGQIYFIHNKPFLFQDVLFLGWGGGGFSQTDKDFEKRTSKFVTECSRHKRTVFVTHQPPYGTKLDYIYETHVGNKSFRAFIRKIQPIMAISGHIHETERKTDLLGKTFLVNPGRFGLLLKI